MAKTQTKIIIVTIVILTAVAIVYAWNSMPDVPRWERGYAQILAGDPKQKVVEILGKPTEIKNCWNTSHSSPPEIAERCAEEYWYVAFMQEGGYVLDKDGKVITSWHTYLPKIIARSLNATAQV